MRGHSKAPPAAPNDGRGNRRRIRFAAAMGAALVVALVVGLSSASAEPPVVTVNAPSAVSYTSAHLSGTVDPTDQETFWEFETSTDGVNWSGFNFAQPPLAAGSGSQEVTQDLTGLEDGVTYFARLAVFSGSEGIFGQSAEPNPEFTTIAMAAPAVTIDAPSAVTASSAHFTGHINPEAPAGNPTEFDVNWNFECTPECSGLVGGTVAADSSDHTVETDATGLEPGVHYEVTLHASNAGNSVSVGAESFTTAAVAPALSAITANPSYNEATLSGKINPDGAATNYHFEYGPTAAYGNSTAVGTIPAGNLPVKITGTALGLTPAVGYHYRLVASNSAGPVASADGTFATVSEAAGPENCPNAAIRIEQDSTWLPDCRAFELVNPPGVDVGEVVRSIAASDNGEEVSWATPVPPDWASGNRLLSWFAAFRGPTGWTSQDANANVAEGIAADSSSMSTAFSSDFTRELYITSGDSNPAQGTRNTDLLRIDVGHGGTFTKVNPNAVPETFLAGASPDLSRVVYQRSTPAGLRELYAWDEHTGVELVSVLPDGTPAPNANIALPPNTPNTSFVNLIPSAIAAHEGSRAVTANGTKIFFFTENTGGPLYLRNTVTGVTTAVSASRRTGEVGAVKTGAFLGASSGGEIVFISSPEPLTDAEAPNGGIYEVNTRTETTRLVAAGPVLSNAIVSPDGSHLYFVAGEVLAPGAQAGAQNVYVWSGGSLKFVASSSASIEASRTTIDGRYLVLKSSGEIDGSKNEGHVALFEYDAVTGETVCASCRPNGGPSEGDASLTAIPTFTTVNGSQMRNIANDGRLFFDSTDRIVPADRTGALDVYEFHAGTVSLLSAGRGDQASFLAENSDSGRDVFILTRSPFVAADKDGAELDMYDVRAGGGFPNQPAPINCAGEDCQGAADAPPAAAALGSTAVAGAGNVKAQPKKHHKKAHKKNHRKHKGHKRKKGHGKDVRQHRAGADGRRAGR